MYRLKKSLGQHFLKDDSIIQRIIENVSKQEFSNLLEIGAGAGALTRHLVNLPGKNFKAVELDDEKVMYLLQQYPELKDKIIPEDFLKMMSILGSFTFEVKKSDLAIEISRLEANSNAG